MSAFGPEDRLPIGTTIRDTYVVEGFLGAGGFSSVYEVRHRFLGPQAMKVFRAGPGLPTTAQILEEAVLLAGIVDDHVVRAFEANTLDDTADQRPYMTTELIRGGSVEELLVRKTRLQPKVALQVALQIAAGLAVAHQRRPPVVHRDVKPQNILVQSVSASGLPRVKVGDFGLARHVDPDSRMARAAGTLHFLAPEAIWGIHTPASDVYSTGIVLYRMLTGLYPFPLTDNLSQPPEAQRQALLRTRRSLPHPPSTYCLGLPRDVDALIQSTLAPEPHDRPADAVELGARISLVLAELP